MNKEQFIAALRARLSQLADEEIDKSAAYYAEMIDDMVEDGKTEQEAVSSLEDVDVIAERILQDMPISALVKSSVKPKGGWTALTIILAVLASPIWLPIAISLLAVFLSLYIVLWSLLISFIGTAASLLISGIAVIVGAFILMPQYILPTIGAGLILLGAGLLLALGVKYAIVGTIRMSAAIGRGIKKMFIRKER